ncbi:MAG: HupE/UreJ family protein [Gemmatimonadetes bacterium]|nr:HupE/UreJ family protein [Gemmatimonadota bacterium]
MPAGPATAHDLGLARVTLSEITEGRYSLDVRLTAGSLTFATPPGLPERAAVLEAALVSATGGARFELVAPGGLTAADTLVAPWGREGVVATAHWLDGTTGTAYFAPEPGGTPVPLAQLRATSGTFGRAARRYFDLGVIHIFLGVDHLLFVLGLLLLVRGTGALIKTVTAFTLAHSLTLALAVFDVVHVSSRAVDAVVALSIVFVATEIVHAERGRAGLSARWPWVVSFAFGLLHGLGFAGALGALGLPRPEIPVALLFFNLGVEAGQLVFVFAVVAARAAIRTLRFEPRPWARLAPGYALGVVAGVWLIQRLDIIWRTIAR